MDLPAVWKLMVLGAVILATLERDVTAADIATGPCVVNKTQLWNDDRNVALEFVYTMADLNDGALISFKSEISDADVFLVARLNAFTRYRSFTPVNCTMTAEDASSTASVTILRNGTIVPISGLVLGSQSYTEPGNSRNSRMHHIQLKPAVFVNAVMQSGMVHVTCDFELCIDVTEDNDRCKLLAVTTPRASILSDRSQKQADYANRNTAGEFRALETSEQNSCVDQGAFIGLECGLAIVFLALIIANGIAASKLSRGGSRNGSHVSSRIVTAQPARPARPAASRPAGRRQETTIVTETVNQPARPRVPRADTSSERRPSRPVIGGGRDGPPQRLSTETRRSSEEEDSYW